jgi:hypothetical protein
MRRTVFSVGHAPLQVLGAACLLALAGCAAPEHSNTLIFGTTTKVALDVSQDPTGAVGVTLGYRRQEAVWMPLLPNQGKPNERAPAECKDKVGCPMFVGKEGDDHDTYSVFASFGGKGGGGAGVAEAGARAEGQIVQYFATGLAARKLAEGGAALVNTTADPLTSMISPARRAAIVEGVARDRSRANDFAARVSTNGKVDKAKLDKAITDAKLPADGSLAKAMRKVAGEPTGQLADILLVHAPSAELDALTGAKP